MRHLVGADGHQPRPRQATEQTDRVFHLSLLVRAAPDVTKYRGALVIEPGLLEQLLHVDLIDDGRGCIRRWKTQKPRKHPVQFATGLTAHPQRLVLRQNDAFRVARAQHTSIIQSRDVVLDRQRAKVATRCQGEAIAANVHLLVRDSVLNCVKDRVERHVAHRATLRLKSRGAIDRQKNCWNEMFHRLHTACPAAPTIRKGGPLCVIRSKSNTSRNRDDTSQTKPAADRVLLEHGQILTSWFAISSPSVPVRTRPFLPQSGCASHKDAPRRTRTARIRL